MIGTTISHYKVLKKLGAGGMGVVYQAEDTKLDRIVALKFVPHHLLGDEEIRKRFEREAKAAAALHHPNICPIFEIDDVEGRSFIVMALIEGETLGKKISRGPLKLEEALEIAQNVAQGLAAAHEKGTTHRDIKPENVIVDDRRHVTIMDFGLAQLARASSLTRRDQTIGTTSYMSPEQCEGSGADHRTDIWSLGVVLYEMVTGQRPFTGDYDKAVIYSILNERHEPITGVRAGLPMELELCVSKCLAKNADDRFQSAGELVIDLRTIMEKVRLGPGGRRPLPSGDVGQQPARVAAATAPHPRREAFAWVVAATMTMVVLGVLLIQLRESSAPPPNRLFTLNSPSKVSDPAISPNGRYVAYLAGAETAVWVQELNQQDARKIDGTQGASYPFWSVAGDSIAFGAGNELKRVSVGGGPVFTICRMPDQPFGGGSFAPDGDSIVFAAGGIGKLYRVPARSGEPLLLVEHAEGSDSYTHPQFLPNSRGRKLLLFGAIGASGASSSRRIVVRDLETGEQQDMVNGKRPTYSPSGHILYEYNVGARISGPCHSPLPRPRRRENVLRLLPTPGNQVSQPTKRSFTSTTQGQTRASLCGGPEMAIESRPWVCPWRIWSIQSSRGTTVSSRLTEASMGIPTFGCIRFLARSGIESHGIRRPTWFPPGQPRGRS